MAIVDTHWDISFEDGDDEPSDQIGTNAADHAIRWGNGGENPGDVPVGTSVFPPAIDGSQMVRFLLIDGDSSPSFGGAQRAEYHLGNHVAHGGRGWYGWILHVPDNFEQDRGPYDDGQEWRILGQFHENDGSPSFRFDLDTGGDGKFTLSRKTSAGARGQTWDIDTAEDAKGKFYRIVVGARWTSTTSGWIKVWVNDTLIADLSGIATMTNTSNVYLKIGVYGRRGGLFYYDDLKTIEVNDDDDYYDEVAPASLTPSTTRTVSSVAANLLVSATVPPTIVEWSEMQQLNTTSITAPAPTGTAAGDRALCIIRCTPGTTVTPPAGITWSSSVDIIDGTTRAAVYLSEPLSTVESLTFNVSPQVSNIRITRASLRGPGTVTLGAWDNEPSSGSSTNTVAPTLTVPTGGSIILPIWTLDTPRTYTLPAGVTEEHSFTQGWSNHIVVGRTASSIASGASSAYTATLDSAIDSTLRRNVQVALSPTPTGVPAARTVTPVLANISGRLARTVTGNRANVERTLEQTVSSVAANVSAETSRSITGVAANVSLPSTRTVSSVKANVAEETTVSVHPPAGFARRR